MDSLFPGVALVIGAASGIGRQVALSFAQEGCLRIILVDRDSAKLAGSAQMIRGLDLTAAPDLLSLTVDISNEDDIINMMDCTVRKFGRIDYAVNAAGILGNSQSSVLTSSGQFDQINGVNYRGCWLCSRAEIAQMLKQDPLPTHDGRPGNRGSVVNISSQLGVVGREKSSKAAVIGMTRADAIDYSPSQIRVNCVCPGLVDTPMLETFEKHVLQRDIAVAPMNRMGTPQEIADVVLFLASSKASFIQGATFVVDGGYTIN
ncbi:hypothetical protein PV05_09138 [Exophiala xenobiotica]|uniref:Uncharacterized protein n=1 Tax=Exophiala xenobiotica TaxID=348802 RepID=A0A0D2EG36_9EURO|nr:uncharacterized protein PV05_09138 [Exophiala xenobiotica]KIW53580.1 hypothetical protein PV05_09138 [Exophiala xenobiotica]